MLSLPLPPFIHVFTSFSLLPFPLSALHAATKSLFDLCGELYEPEWKGASDFMETKDQKLQAWEEMLGSFSSQLMEPMLQYLSKFPETKVSQMYHFILHIICPSKT